MADKFVLVRITRMREVDLNLFDFDYDLTWMGFFVDAEGRFLGRYGGRDADGPEGRVSLAGLKYAMTQALKKYGSGPEVSRRKPTTVMDFSAAKSLAADACVRCHEVYDIRRRSLLAAQLWSIEELWVYPPPENVGLTVDVDQGDRVTQVKADSFAAKAGIKKGDRLREVNGMSIASYADLQYALHRATGSGNVTVAYSREGKPLQGTLSLTTGWKKSDISWRWSLRAVEPSPWVQGSDLTKSERKTLGLNATQLALEQGPFVSEPARQAGLRQGDVIIGVDGKMLEMTGRQFGAYVRLNYKVGDKVTYNLLRDGRRIDMTLTLRARP